MNKQVGVFFFSLSLAVALLGCKPKNSPDGPNNPTPSRISFTEQRQFLSLGEKLSLKSVLRDDTNRKIDLKEVQIVSDKPDVVAIEEDFIVAKRQGEALLTLTYRGVNSTMDVAVADFSEPFSISGETFNKYIWDYLNKPKTIENKTGRPVVLFFWAEKFATSKMLFSPYRDLAKSYAGKAIFLQIDLPQSPCDGEYILIGLWGSGHEAMKGLIVEDSQGMGYELPILVGLSANPEKPHVSSVDGRLFVIRNWLKEQLP